MTEALITESGLEEFVLYVQNGNIFVAARQDSDSEFGRMEYFQRSPVGCLVKAYAPDGCQGEKVTAVDVEIGYCERRLTPLEILKIRLYVGTYWHIAF